MRQVVQGEVEAPARAQEVLYLGVGFGPAEVGVDADEHDLGHREA